jgi:hypothetical protein
MNDENKIKVLVVEPMKKPYIKEIGTELEDMQEIVGGQIEEYMPFDDEVAIVCNEEGKIIDLPYNRAVYDSDGRMLDVIQGTFFLCNAPFDSENFLSITPEQEEKYSKKFDRPEQFIQTKTEITVMPITPMNKEYER